MAITNAMIIFSESQRLLEEGKIKPTGRTFIMEMPDGSEVEVPEAEEIHTFAHWKEIGYQVRKGEHAIADFSIWKYTVKAKGEGEEEAQQKGHCFMKR